MNQRSRSFFPRCQAIALLLSLWAVSLGAQAVDNGRVPLFYSNESQPGARGAALGVAYREAFPDLEARWDAYLQQVFSTLGGEAQARFDAWLTDIIEPLRSQGLSPEARAEVEGLASTWALVGGNRLGDGQLSHDELWAAQLLPDLGLVGGGVGYAVFGTASADGGPLVGRHRDTLLDPAHRDTEPPLVITVIGQPTQPWAGIGFAGQLAPLTGMNASGLFISQFPVAEPRLASPNKPMQAIGFALREVLERATNLPSATHTLARQRFGVSQAWLIVDRGRAAVLEHPAGKPGNQRTVQSPVRDTLSWGRAEQLAVVNCLALANLRSDCRQLRDRYRWQRLRELARFHASGLQARLGDVIALLQDQANSPYALLGASTIETLVYQPRTQRLYLRTHSEALASDSDTPEQAALAALPMYQPFANLHTDHDSPWLLFLLFAVALLGLLVVALIRYRYRSTQPIKGDDSV